MLGTHFQLHRDQVSQPLAYYAIWGLSDPAHAIWWISLAGKLILWV